MGEEHLFSPYIRLIWEMCGAFCTWVNIGWGGKFLRDYYCTKFFQIIVEEGPLEPEIYTRYIKTFIPLLPLHL